MKAAKALKKLKHLKEMPYPHTQKKLWKRKGNSITPEKCPNFTNFFRMPKTKNSNLSNEKTKNLTMKLGQLQEEITKSYLPVSADISNDITSIILETDQGKIYPSWG